jgi:hypothetical protein
VNAREPVATTTPETSPEVSGVAVPSVGAAGPSGAAGAATGPSKGRRLFDAALPLLVLIAFAVIPLPTCPSRLFVGLPCPGCGLTRATLALLRFDLEAMWRFHPLAPIMTPVVGWALTKPVLEELGWIPKHRVFLRVPNVVWGALVLAFFGLYVARLAGFFGGTPDPIDPASSLLGRALGFVTGHAHAH